LGVRSIILNPDEDWCSLPSDGRVKSVRRTGACRREDRRDLKKGAELLDGQARISDDSGRGERVNRIVARNGQETRPGTPESRSGCSPSLLPRLRPETSSREGRDTRRKSPRRTPREEPCTSPPYLDLPGEYGTPGVQAVSSASIVLNLDGDWRALPSGGRVRPLRRTGGGDPLARE